MDTQDPNQNTTPKLHPQLRIENKKEIGELIRFAIIVLIIFLPVRFFIAKPFVVSGASMDPTFHSGEYLIVDQISYRFEEPKRGDVIVFRYPYETSKYYIKRIIGLPGETIKMDEGKVTVTNDQNPKGVALDENYVTHHSEESFTKTLGATEYFVMGDNRPASSDSRSWGPLKAEFITGKPVVRLFPFDTVSLNPGRIEEK